MSFPAALRDGLRIDVRLVSLCHVSFLAALREGLRIDVRLVSLAMRISLPPSRGIRLDVKLVSLCHLSFPAALRDGLRIDVMLISLCHTCFPPALQERLQRWYTYVLASGTLHSTAPPEEQFNTPKDTRTLGGGGPLFESVNICRTFFVVL
jgi:hypothetical protein